MRPNVDIVESDQDLPAEADVVIIGGGIIGVSTAWTLARRGVSVVLCEKGRIAGEQSSRNWGFCRQQGRDPREIPLIIESLRIWRGIEKEIEAPVGFTQAGCLYLAETDEQVKGYEDWLEHAKPYQLDSRLIGHDEVNEKMPGAAIDYKAALFTASDGRAEPAKAAPAIAKAARRAGAQIFTGCAVRGVETSGGKVSAAVTEKGTIRTQAVVLAGGAWSRLFCGNNGLALPQLKVLSSVMRTGPMPLITENAVWGPGFAYRRRDDGGYNIAHGSSIYADIVPDSFKLAHRFMSAFWKEQKSLHLRVGRQFWRELTMKKRWRLDQETPFERTRVLDPDPSDKILDQAFTGLTRALPAFKEAEIVERWAGYIDVTPDEVPVISPIDQLPGLVIATGFSGHGFGIGPAAGRLTADLVTGGNPIVDPAPFRFSRFFRQAGRTVVRARSGVTSMQKPVAKSWYETISFGDGVTLIREIHVATWLRCNIWHIRGRDRDLLIDAGMGLVPLKPEVARLTERPVTAIASHAHFDHIGGSHEFCTRRGHQAEAHIHEAPTNDNTAVGSFVRAETFSAWPYEGFTPEIYKVQPAPLTGYLDEGDVVDLGDRVFQVFHLPGHSPGSIALYEKATGVLFSGDVVYNGALFDTVYHSDPAIYEQSLNRLRELDVSQVHGGHYKSFGRRKMISIIDEYLAGGRRISDADAWVDARAI